MPKPEHDYVAHARKSNNAETTLHFMGRDGYFRGWAWGDYNGIDLAPPVDAGSGPAVVLYFAGRRPVEVTIEGRHLDGLHVALGDNRIRWIREMPAGTVVKDTKEPVITRLIFREPEPSER